MDRTQNRRDFMKTRVSGAAAVASSELSPLRPQLPPAAVARAFEAGASGVLASREYDEMRLSGLRAFGRAVRESRAGA